MLPLSLIPNVMPVREEKAAEKPPEEPAKPAKPAKPAEKPPEEPAKPAEPAERPPEVPAVAEAPPTPSDEIVVQMPVSLSMLTLKELRLQCEQRGLSQTGKKADLISRLEEVQENH